MPKLGAALAIAVGVLLGSTLGRMVGLNRLLG